MSVDQIIVLVIIGLGIVSFASERIPVDLTSIIILTAFLLTGILTPEEGLSGFSSPATITVAFMFVVSYALLKTGALQRMGPTLGNLLKKNHTVGLLVMFLFVGFASAFINNTPVVAMLIPVMISVAYQAKISPSKLLIPLSYASIFGGVCTMIGTSTNFVVSGIAEKHGIEFSIFSITPVGIVLLLVGTTYMVLVGQRLLPNRGTKENASASFRDYITEIELMKGSQLIGQSIMESIFHKELEVDVLQVTRNKDQFALPPGDFIFNEGDVLKIKCDVDKIKEMRGRLHVEFKAASLTIEEGDLQPGNTVIHELIITTGSEFEGKTLREMDFRRRYRAAPLAIKHREEVLHEKLHDVVLRAGDIILTEIKNHRVSAMRKQEMERNSPFIILSEEGIINFDKKKFSIVMAVLAGIVLTSAFDILPIVIGVTVGSIVLVLTRTITMKELHQSIEWRVVFLIAGSLTIGLAMYKTGLSDQIAGLLVNYVGQFGPLAVLICLYLATTLLTEIMSNNATAALFSPIAISLAATLGVNPIPFLVAVMMAASSSFMTPIGYQTNTMVYTSGQYKFADFFRVGVWLNILLWIAACLIIPLIFPF